MKKYIIAIILTVNAHAEIPDKFFHALHQVEASGKFGAIKGDSGKALGPFQIHKVYWVDAISFDKTIGGKYEDCADYNYSLKIVKSYLQRYAKEAVRLGDAEKLARIHNGGPQGHKKSATKNYWQKVEKVLIR